MAWTDLAAYAAGRFTVAMAEELRGNFKAIGDAWPAYTPVVTGTGWAAGNATLIGGWLSVGKLAIFRFTITIGSTTTPGTGALSITLPSTSAVTNIPGGNMTIFDTSAPATRQRNMYINTSTTVAAQDESGAFVTGAVPFALATGDTLKGAGFYQQT